MRFKKDSILALVIVVAVLMAGTWVYWQYQSGRNIRNLKSVEVRQYQGQNLSSVTIIPETSIKGPQHIDINTYKLKISGLVAKPLLYSFNEVINNFQSYKKVVTLDCVEGWNAKILWQGILLKDLLAQSQPNPEAKTIIFHAYDGYTTSFPVDYIMNNDILMAYKMNGLDLTPETGFPFELVAEDKWGYKWIKWITEIEFSSDINYKGYWESKGYSDTGNLNQPFFNN
jgi:DMSO/TMAO reductase YedYZ molybdopterin-dependent catalytic subunit